MSPSLTPLPARQTVLEPSFIKYIRVFSPHKLKPIIETRRVQSQPPPGMLHYFKSVKTDDLLVLPSLLGTTVSFSVLLFRQPGDSPSYPFSCLVVIIAATLFIALFFDDHPNEQLQQQTRTEDGDDCKNLQQWVEWDDCL